jgi:RNA polymerase sigma factor (sigma-70 family)
MAKLTPEEIEKAVDDYFPLVRKLAEAQQRRLPPGINELDDLLGAASERLVVCLHKYDTSGGASLSSWISRQVRGAFLDHLRSKDHLPQVQRQRVKLVQETAKELEQQFKRVPSAAEIAADIESTPEEVEKIVEMGVISTVSIDSDEAPELVLEEGSVAELLAALNEAWAKLTPDQAQVMRMRFEGFGLEEIGQSLDTNRSKVWRLAQAALRTIKGHLEEEE